MRNFVQESTSLKKYEKIKFAEDIYSNASKESINLIVDYIINLVKKNKNLKEKLEYKKMLRYPVNMKLLLNQFTVKCLKEIEMSFIYIC